MNKTISDHTVGGWLWSLWAIVEIAGTIFRQRFLSPASGCLSSSAVETSWFDQRRLVPGLRELLPKQRQSMAQEEEKQHTQTPQKTHSLIPAMTVKACEKAEKQPLTKTKLSMTPKMNVSLLYKHC
jgi:hypothetical protein